MGIWLHCFYNVNGVDVHNDTTASKIWSLLQPVRVQVVYKQYGPPRLWSNLTVDGVFITIHRLQHWSFYSRWGVYNDTPPRHWSFSLSMGWYYNDTPPRHWSFYLSMEIVYNDTLPRHIRVSTVDGVFITDTVLPQRLEFLLSMGSFITIHHLVTLEFLLSMEECL